MKKKYWLPTTPYSFQDAVQRFAMSMGIANPESPDVCYDNGKQIYLTFNDYRQYYVAEYYYNGRNVVARNHDFALCLASAIATYKRHGKGAALIVTCENETNEKACIQAGLLPYSQEILEVHEKTFITWTSDELKAQFTPSQLQRAACGIYKF